MLSGHAVAYLAPTYKMLTGVWRNLKAILAPIITNKNETYKTIETLTGGTLDCWSLERADSIRGRAYHYVVIDEAAFVPDLQDSWSKVIRPLLTDHRGGALMVSTPKGRNGFWHFFSRGQDELLPDWASWEFPTSANPYIHPAEIAEAKATLPSLSFQQEYLAEFVEDAGGVFRGVSDVSVLQPAEPYEGQFVFGVDWGKSNDFTVISVIDRDKHAQVYKERFNQISWEHQRGRLKHLFDLWKPYSILAESNSIGDPNIEALQNDGLPVQGFATTAQTKTPLIDDLALAIERQNIRLLDDPVQVMELQAYQMERLPSGKWRYNAPAGSHDDTVIALALAWRAINTGFRVLFD